MSHNAAWKAEKMGYTNVKNYAGGYPDWIKQKGNYGSVATPYVAGKIEANQSVIIDSRPLKTKYVKGHVPTAISIPFSEFETLKGKLPRGLDTELIFYCGGLACRLSHKSADEAIKMGYTNVKVYSEGYPAWKQAYGDAGQTVQVAAGETEGSIDLEKFKDILASNPESIMLVDVRDPDEFAKGHLPTAVNIPVDKLEEKIKGFKGDKPIVFTCATGARSGEAYYMTKDVREDLKDVFYVEATIEYSGDGKYTIKKPH